MTRVKLPGNARSKAITVRRETGDALRPSAVSKLVVADSVCRVRSPPCCIAIFLQSHKRLLTYSPPKGKGIKERLHGNIWKKRSERPTVGNYL